MPLITTNEFTPAEVKEIAAKALAEYKKLSLIGHVKHPRKALKTAFRPATTDRKIHQKLAWFNIKFVGNMGLNLGIQKHARIELDENRLHKCGS